MRQWRGGWRQKERESERDLIVSLGISPDLQTLGLSASECPRTHARARTTHAHQTYKQYVARSHGRRARQKSSIFLLHFSLPQLPSQHLTPHLPHEHPVQQREQHRDRRTITTSATSCQSPSRPSASASTRWLDQTLQTRVHSCERRPPSRPATTALHALPLRGKKKKKKTVPVPSPLPSLLLLAVSCRQNPGF